MSNFNPIPPTKKELKQLKKQYEKERLERLNKLDDKKLTAVLHYYKGTIQTSQYHVGLHKLYSDEKNTWNSVVMLGTERQRCADDTIDNITASYNIDITEQMRKDYKNNGNKLVIYF
tara:strand:- start:1222 stop:1572 length:351 start_codon:yes stop_codon:yes gene_type:complete